MRGLEIPGYVYSFYPVSRFFMLSGSEETINKRGTLLPSSRDQDPAQFKLTSGQQRHSIGTCPNPAVQVDLTLVCLAIRLPRLWTIGIEGTERVT